jgi:hypothetical protein
MAKSTKNKRRKKWANYKPLIIISIVLIAIVAVSVVIGYFLTTEESLEDPKSIEQNEPKDTKALESVKTPLEGTWVSNYDGAILSVNGLTYNLDLPSVDASVSTKGTLAVEQNLVTFINSNGDEVCRNMEGHYQFIFNEDEVSFKLIKDSCNSRIERMTMSWFKL